MCSCLVCIVDCELLKSRSKILNLKIQFVEIEDLKFAQKNKLGTIQFIQSANCKDLSPGSLNPKNAKYILDNLETKTSISFDSRYAKIYNEKFKKNLNNPHIMCVKSSGTPYLLFCTQINNVNYCFLIDKKIKDGYEYPKIFIVQ